MRLVYLLGSGNDHSKFAVLCGFCGLFAAAAAGAMSPPGFFAFDLRAAAVALHAWGKGAAGEAAAGLLLLFTTTEAGGDGTGAADGGSGDGDGGGAGGGIREEDFVALFFPVAAVAAACVTAAAALPAVRFAQVRFCAAAAEEAHKGRVCFFPAAGTRRVFRGPCLLFFTVFRA